MSGYFGKVSTHGDFVTRRLPPELVRAWDGWLQDGLQASRTQLGAGWLDAYLTSPVWRFAIAPGVLGDDGLGGVMMPSVDRVGRYFPLMLATVGAPPLLDWLQRHRPWFALLDALARASLEPGFTLALLDDAPEPPLATLAPQERCLPLDAATTETIAAVALQGHSLWWHEGSDENSAARLLVCHGMPPPASFAAMLASAPSRPAPR